MPSRVVGIESRKLPLANGEWLLVKDRLSAGERNAGFDRMYARNPDGSYVVSPTGRLVVHPLAAQLATILTYLVDWNLTAPNGEPLTIRGQPVSVVVGALESIDPESYDEIRDAIEAHETAMAAARAQEKKVPAGAPASPPNSPSPDPAPGPSRTSEG